VGWTVVFENVIF